MNCLPSTLHDEYEDYVSDAIPTCPLCGLSPVEIDDHGDEMTFCELCGND